MKLARYQRRPTGYDLSGRGGSCPLKLRRQTGRLEKLESSRLKSVDDTKVFIENEPNQIEIPQVLENPAGQLNTGMPETGRHRGGL